VLEAASAQQNRRFRVSLAQQLHTGHNALRHLLGVHIRQAAAPENRE
jgi:hypothetical protein